MFIRLLLTFILTCIAVSVTAAPVSNLTYRNKYLFITDLHAGTFGDLYGASKFIQALVNFNRGNIQVSLVIRSDRADNDPNILEVTRALKPHCQVLLINDWHPDILDSTLLQQAAESAQVIIFPAYDYIGQSGLLKIVEKLNNKQPIVLYTEYDFDFSSVEFEGTPHLCCGTGVGWPRKSNLGYLIEPYTLTPPVVPKDVQALLYKEKTLKDYLDTHNLFFSYLVSKTKKDSSLSSNNVLDSKLFSLAALKKSLSENSNKNVDIITSEPVQIVEWISKSSHALSILPKLQKIQYINKQGLQEENNQEDFRGSITLRFINPYPLSNKEFVDLMRLSDDFIGVTGDQSFSEGLSLEKLNAYQIRTWKQEMFNGFNDYVLEKFGRFSPLHRFYRAHLYLENGTDLEREKKYLKDMENIFKQGGLLKNQARVLSLALQDEMNLYQHIKSISIRPILELEKQKMLKSMLLKHFLGLNFSKSISEEQSSESFNKLMQNIESQGYKGLYQDVMLQDLYGQLLYYYFVQADQTMSMQKELIWRFVNRISCLVLHPRLSERSIG